MFCYFAGMSVGIVLLQSSIIAPTMAKNLDSKDFGPVIRAIWPKFFLLLAATGVGGLVTLATSTAPSLARWSVAGMTVAFALICYAMIPATNRASDRGNTAAFRRLHLASVGMTVAVLAANISAVLL